MQKNLENTNNNLRELISERQAIRIIEVSRPTLRKYRRLGFLQPEFETEFVVLYSRTKLIKFKKDYDSGLIAARMSFQ